MTVNRGPGVAPIAGVGTTTVEHRLQLAGLYTENAPGVPRSGVLNQGTTQLVTGRLDMSYDVGPAALVISRTAGEGVYTPTLTGTTNVPTDAAPATNSRWDLIYVKQNDQAKGDADNQAVIGVQKGLAAASPTKPTADLPAGAYVIAEARIFAGTTGTTGGSNTIAQLWRHTSTRGGIVGVRNTTERAEFTAPAIGQHVARLDLAGAPLERWDGAAWTPAAESVTPAPPDAGWTVSGGLVKVRSLGGLTMVTMAIKVTRTASGGSFPIGPGFTTLLSGFIPSGWRPAVVTDMRTVVNDGAAAGQTEPVVRVGTDGTIAMRPAQGYAAVTGQAGWFFHLQGSWYL